MTSILNRIVTSMPRLGLRALTAADAERYFSLVQKNRAHLTQFGDYEELVSSSVSDIKHVNRPSYALLKSLGSGYTEGLLSSPGGGLSVGKIKRI
jgi:hypothetical protein